MGLLELPKTCLLSLAFALFFFTTSSGDTQVSFKFFKAPREFSRSTTATFAFQVLVGANNVTCTGCNVTCQLDVGPASDCGARDALYEDLQDGQHSFVVCSTGFHGVGCSTYNWTIDTIRPTANISASSSFTNALNISVYVSFSEPCNTGGGFACSSANACNLLVYGPGEVIPSSFTVLQPNLKYSLLVTLSPSATYGRVILVMDKNFCSDSAGNLFTRAKNSSTIVRFDRRSVSVDLRTHVPEKSLQVENKARTVQATNNYDQLKLYLYFSEPIHNSSSEIRYSLNTSVGDIVPIDGKTLGNRRFGFQVANVSTIAIVDIMLNSNSILSRSGTPVSPIAPVTFLYDSKRPAVRVSTTSSTRTRAHRIPVSIKFTKPVFGFNSSSLSISGGHVQSFHEISWSKYIAEINADNDAVTIIVPQNVTTDVAGNKNQGSNILQVRHYVVPAISSVGSVVVTASFLTTSVVAGLLTVSTSSLLSIKAFSRPSSFLTADPTKILFRSACHIQFFAFSRWFPVTLPVQYYEFARGLQWSIPYFTLPWETGGTNPIMVGSNASTGPHSLNSKVKGLVTSESQLSSTAGTSLPGLPLTSQEYRFFFESQIYRPEAENIVDLQRSNGWRDFDRSMFWLAVICSSLILLHFLLSVVLRFKRKDLEKKRGYGALVFPRFEIFMTMLAIPCLCEAATALVKGLMVQGGTRSGAAVGILLLVIVGSWLLALFLFLSVGITLGRLLQYKEVHQEGQIFHWYQELIRVTLGPGKRGQWTWKNQQRSVYLTKLGPLFEDLRGPPKYMLSQISGGNPAKQGAPIIASDDETEDAEAPFIQKLFGILRIYYTLLESVKRALLGIVAGVYSNTWSSKGGVLIILSITSFQFLFLLLKKPFIKKKVQLVEIVSISCQVVIATTCFVLLEVAISPKTEKEVGIFMIVVFLVGFLAQMTNEWYALYKQTRRLDPLDQSFLTGLKHAVIGLLLLVIPSRFSQKLRSKLPMNQLGDRETTGENSSSADRNRSSGSRSSGTIADKPWMRQLREMARASFTKEGPGGPSGPSTSRTKWSGFWSMKRSGSSSQNNSSDFKSKPNKLYKDLEAIFASK